MFLVGALILLEFFELGRVHVLYHVVRLPLLETETHSFMTVIFVVCLVFVILDLHKLAVLGRRIQTKRYQTGNGSCLGNQTEGPGLLVFELDDIVVGTDYLVGFID